VAGHWKAPCVTGFIRGLCVSSLHEHTFLVGFAHHNFDGSSGIHLKSLLWGRVVRSYRSACCCPTRVASFFQAAAGLQLGGWTPGIAREARCVASRNDHKQLIFFACMQGKLYQERTTLRAPTPSPYPSLPPHATHTHHPSRLPHRVLYSARVDGMNAMASGSTARNNDLDLTQSCTHHIC